VLTQAGREGEAQVLPKVHHNPKEDNLRRRLLLLVGLTILGALLLAPVALAQDDSSASASASSATASASVGTAVGYPPPGVGTPIATATATASGSASAVTSASALPATGGPTSSPLMGVGALMLLASAGMVSVAIVRRTS
jgi:hypothetical protein